MAMEKITHRVWVHVARRPADNTFHRDMVIGVMPDAEGRIRGRDSSRSHCESAAIIV